MSQRFNISKQKMAISFEIVKKSKKSKARLGILKTPSGIVETPALVAVATAACVRTLTSYDVELTGTQILIANSLHLHLRPGEKIIQKAGGIHKFMNWERPIMTDSGGFQVFSWGFGRDFGLEKIQKGKIFKSVSLKEQPKFLRITDKGVYFRSPIDGSETFLSPQKAIRIQEMLGADIIFVLDECTPPNATKAYTRESLKRTHLWAKISLQSKRSSQAMFGIVQGGRFKDLRVESARFISSLPFDGFGIGGEFGKGKWESMIALIKKYLPEEKPLHLLGIGYIKDIPKIVRSGIDLFDCVVPTRYARHGIAFTERGKINISRARFLKKNTPLDLACDCIVCKNYNVNYICHLFYAKETLGPALLSFHNLYFFNKYVKELRGKIKEGKL